MQMDRSEPIPIYGTRMTLGLINTKLKEHRQTDRVKLIEFEPGDVIDLDPFKIEPVYVSHSVPGSVGFAIETPVGTVFHTGDYKFDRQPGRRARHRRGGAAPARRQGHAGAVLGLRARREPGLDRLRDDGQREPREADRRGARAGDRHDVRLEPGPAAAGGPHRPPARPEGRGGRSEHGPEPEGRRRDRLPRRAGGHAGRPPREQQHPAEPARGAGDRAARASRPRC